MSTTKTATPKVDSSIATDMIDHATARAIDDKVFKLLCRQADHAGKVAGAMVHNADAKQFWKTLGDDMARCAYVMFPPTPDQKAIPAPDAVLKATAQLRDSCALVNIAIKAAQSYARRLAVEQFKAAQMADNAKKARDSIIKLLTRHLEQYGVKVIFQTGKVEKIAVKVAAETSDAEKAANAVENGTGADFAAFVDALCKLAPDQQKIILDKVGESYAAWSATQATETVKADSASGEVVKQEHNDIKARAEKRANG